jgi:hypothetical protein
MPDQVELETVGGEVVIWIMPDGILGFEVNLASICF